MTELSRLLISLANLFIKCLPFVKKRDDIEILKIEKSTNGDFKFLVLNRSVETATVTRIAIEQYSSNMSEDVIVDTIRYNRDIGPRKIQWIDYPIKEIEENIYLFIISALIFDKEIEVEKRKRI